MEDVGGYISPGSGGGGGSGTVTSVGLSLPGIFSVSGSPVTTAGTLTATLASQTANTVLAAPNGAAGSPTFRALATADIPAGLPYVTSVGLALPGIFSVSGSPVTTAGTLTATLASQTANTVLAAPNGAAGSPTFRALATADIPAGLPYVTSVGLALPGIFSVSGSPVTTAGTLTATLASQTANTVLAAPNGAAGAPTFRALVAADLPAGGSAAMTLISTITPAGAANVAFSAIPGTYKHLMIVGRLLNSAGVASLNMTINGDSTADYSWQNTTNAASTSGISASLIQMTNSLGGTGGGGSFTAFIPEYATARPFISVRGELVSHNASLGTAPNDVDFAGVWSGNAAITSVTIALSAGNLTGTVSLYGLS